MQTNTDGKPNNLQANEVSNLLDGYVEVYNEL